MTTALFTDYKLIAGTTESGNLYAQFWGPSKVAGIVSDGCWAWMNSVDVGSFAFGVSHDCPDDLVPDVLEVWAAFRAGDLPEPTHTVEWRFSKPDFQRVTRPLAALKAELGLTSQDASKGGESSWKRPGRKA